MTVKLLQSGGLIFTRYKLPRGAEISIKISDVYNLILSTLTIIVFSSTFFGFHRDVTCYQIVLQEGDAPFSPSQWIHFVHTPVDSITCACHFIMETHLHQSVLAFNKELDAGLAKFLVPELPRFDCDTALCVRG